VNDDNPSAAPQRRSQAWFGRLDRDGFIYRSWLKNRGIPHDPLDGRRPRASAAPIPKSPLQRAHAPDAPHAPHAPHARIAVLRGKSRAGIPKDNH